MPWRGEDEALLQRLEDELIVEKLWAFALRSRAHVPSATEPSPRPIHPRAAGLVAELRKVPGAAELVAGALRTSSEGGDVAPLARMLDALVLRDCSPELLHHLALFRSKAAVALERTAPEDAADAWVRALAAWLALADEHTDLGRLERAILEPSEPTAPKPARQQVPFAAPLSLVTDVARRAEASAQDLGTPGRAALLALARTDEAVRIAGASDELARRTRVHAERHRNAAIEAALTVIGEALDEANVRGELATSGGSLLLRALAVWTWTSNDEAVEHFVVDRIDRIGWELYRARKWDSLRYLLDPFRPMFDSLARRIARDPAQIAYAAGCAQMFVFLAEVERGLEPKLELAERAVQICPTHRNGRLILAAALCDQAIQSMKAMLLFAPKREVARIEALVERARSLYPDSAALADAISMLERIKTGKINV